MEEDPTPLTAATRARLIGAALGLVLVGVALAAAGFAVSSSVGTGTMLVALGPFILAARLFWRALRDKLWALGVVAAAALVLVGIGALMAPYVEYWDLTGDALVSRAEAVPASATGTFHLPAGDPGISGIYAAFVGESGSFDRADGDDSFYLAFVEGAPTADGYVATDVARVATRHRMPWEGTQYRRIVGHCTGSATFAGAAWTLSFTDRECAVANGRYARATTRR